METSTPGTYSFTFAQGSGPADPIQNRGIVPLNFKIDLPGFVIFSPTGTMSDGTTSFSPGLSGWGDISGMATSINPNLINSGNSGPLTAMGDSGIDFDSVAVRWSFTSSGSFENPTTNLTGFVVQAVPEPSSFAMFGMGLACLARRRRLRKVV
jgi:hypothetical protein